MSLGVPGNHLKPRQLGPEKLWVIFLPKFLLVKIYHFPRDSGEHKTKKLKPPPFDDVFFSHFKLCIFLGYKVGPYQL